MQAGVRLRHYELGTTCTAYLSNLETAPAGPFATKLIVTMRAIRRDQSERVIEVTRRFSESHGEPVHVGDPAAIGIMDLADTYEDIGLNDVQNDELPMFWACGVTALEAVRAAAPAPRTRKGAWNRLFGSVPLRARLGVSGLAATVHGVAFPRRMCKPGGFAAVQSDRSDKRE